ATHQPVRWLARLGAAASALDLKGLRRPLRRPVEHVSLLRPGELRRSCAIRLPGLQSVLALQPGRAAPLPNALVPPYGRALLACVPLPGVAPRLNGAPLQRGAARLRPLLLWPPQVGPPACPAVPRCS